MRLVLVVAALALAVPRAVSADPTPMIQTQKSLRDFFHGVVDHLAAWAPAPIPDLSILTTEPVARTESSGYGWREDPIRKRQKFHHGTDFRADPGTPVVVAGDGIVMFAGRSGGYGKCVFVDHGGGVITRYAHLRRIETKVGAVLSAGERIGQVGSTGRSTGPHLHFEVRLDGRPVDPNTALIVAELAREAPDAARLAAFALAPELQRMSRDLQDPKNRSRRPERSGAPKRQQVLW